MIENRTLRFGNIHLTSSHMPTEMLHFLTLYDFRSHCSFRNEPQYTAGIVLALMRLILYRCRALTRVMSISGTVFSKHHKCMFKSHNCVVLLELLAEYRLACGGLKTLSRQPFFSTERVWPFESKIEIVWDRAVKDSHTPNATTFDPTISSKMILSELPPAWLQDGLVALVSSDAAPTSNLVPLWFEPFSSSPAEWNFSSSMQSFPAANEDWPTCVWRFCRPCFSYI